MEEKSITPEGIINQAMGLNMTFPGAEFPVGIFPSKIQRIIHEVYESQSYPIDYTAAAILIAIAVGIGNSHLIQMKQRWVESAILFVALVGRPGANKSHPLSFAMKPFIDFDYSIYGHTHQNMPEIIIRKTKLLTNQLGYVKYSEHDTFDCSAYINV